MRNADVTDQAADGISVDRPVAPPLAERDKAAGDEFQAIEERRDLATIFLAVVRVPTTDVSVLGTLIADLGQWLAAEYLAVHGPKTPRQE